MARAPLNSNLPPIATPAGLRARAVTADVQAKAALLAAADRIETLLMELAAASANCNEDDARDAELYRSLTAAHGRE